MGVIEKMMEYVEKERKAGREPDKNKLRGVFMLFDGDATAEKIVDTIKKHAGKEGELAGSEKRRRSRRDVVKKNVRK